MFSSPKTTHPNFILLILYILSSVFFKILSLDQEKRSEVLYIQASFLHNRFGIESSYAGILSKLKHFVHIESLKRANKQVLEPKIYHGTFRES